MLSTLITCSIPSVLILRLTVIMMITEVVVHLGIHLRVFDVTLGSWIVHRGVLKQGRYLDKLMKMYEFYLPYQVCYLSGYS